MPAKPLPPLRELPLMTPWYGPKALAQTGLRDFISRVFGSYADQRIMQAAVDYKPPEEIAQRYDYSNPKGDRAIPPSRGWRNLDRLRRRHGRWLRLHVCDGVTARRAAS